MKVQALRVEWSALEWMMNRQKLPKYRDNAELPGLGEVKIGMFWNDCKTGRRCGRPPYDRLLTNPILRADYRCHNSGTRKLLVPR